MIISWIRSMFNKPLSGETFSGDLDKSRENLNRLIELTEHLDEVERNTLYQGEFLKIVTNSLDMPIWVKDVNGRFLFLNDSCAKKILKTTVDKALNLTDLDFEEDALAKVCMESDRHVQKMLKTCRFIEYAQYADHILWVDVTKSPLIMDGKLMGVVGSAKDISEFVPPEIKNRFKDYGLIQIDVDLVYGTTKNGGRRKSDLGILLEKCNPVIEL